MGVANPSPPPGILSLSEDQYPVNAYNPPYLLSLYFNDNQSNYPLNSPKKARINDQKSCFKSSYNGWTTNIASQTW